MKVQLIHNPTAGNSGQPDERMLIEMLTQAGHQVRYQSTKQDEWEESVGEECEMVVAAGGDGTVTKVARRLMDRRIPIAVLPVGTANNISKTLGLTEIELKEIVAGWKSGERLPFDIGIATGQWGSKYFIESLGMGLFARIMAELHGRKDAELAKLDDPKLQMKYIQQLLKKRLHNWPAQNFRVVLDGRDIADDCILLEAMNINYVGPNLRLAPRANPGDGILDVVLVSGRDREVLADHLDNFLEGKPISSHLTTYQGKTMRIDSAGMDVHIDDHAFPAETRELNHIDIKIQGHAIEFLVPMSAKAYRKPD
jgi:diacylglycerol kinase (ATP)